jgi:hypothetical protein
LDVEKSGINRRLAYGGPVISAFNLWPDLTMKERLNTFDVLLDYWFEGKDHKAQAKSMDIPGVFPEPIKWLYRVIQKYNVNGYEQSHGDWAEGTPVVVFILLNPPPVLVMKKDFASS